VFQYDRRCLRLTPEEVARRVSAGMPFVVRVRMPDGETSWDDLVHGTITWKNENIGEGDFIILRSDGTPIYNLAVVSDDIAMGITLVMRGDDHISNTPKQIVLYNSLGAEVPRFAHLPMIHGMDGKKLSKRHGAVAVGSYKDKGILPEAMLNFLALLGWSPGNDIEIMTVDQMIELFSTDGLLKKASVFDTQKLEWMNGKHLSMKSAKDLDSLVTDALIQAGVTTREDIQAKHDWYLALIELLKVRARTIDDIVRQAIPYFRDEIEYDDEAIAKQWKDASATMELLRAARESLAAVPRWDASTLENEALRPLAERRGVAAGKIFQPLRVALTGLSVSPGIFDVLVMLGRDRSLTRIDTALGML
jgi:glutamyl-tRNA synthetase